MSTAAQDAESSTSRSAMIQNVGARMRIIATPEAMTPASGLKSATHCSVNA